MQILAKKCHKREAPLDSEVVLSFAIDELLPPYMPEKKDGAPRIAVGAAINLVNRYCLMLPSDIFTSLKPTYTMRTELRGGVNHFICTVFLPMASPLKEPIVVKTNCTFSFPHVWITDAIWLLEFRFGSLWCFRGVVVCYSLLMFM